MNENGIKANEPTTGEIVDALRHCVSKEDCQECRYDMGLDSDCLNVMSADAADRLESQEREIERLIALIGSIKQCHERELSEKEAVMRFTTARAEQAERERDAAVAEFDVIAQDGLCEVCFFGDFSEVSKDTCMEDCCFQWRNKKRCIKQEGDGEGCRVEF